jgi:insertion element IS1 protein InsB
MVLEPIQCPDCQSVDVVKHGRSAAGKQRYCCRNWECSRRSFILNFSYRGRLPQVKAQISDMAINGSGIRDTARVLKISPTTVIETLKKSQVKLNK